MQLVLTLFVVCLIVLLVILAHSNITPTSFQPPQNWPLVVTAAPYAVQLSRQMFLGYKLPAHKFYICNTVSAVNQLNKNTFKKPQSCKQKNGLSQFGKVQANNMVVVTSCHFDSRMSHLGDNCFQSLSGIASLSVGFLALSRLPFKVCRARFS